jgi:RHS repeat-associated protein
MLGRLINASKSGGGWSVGYNYDDYGNLIGKNGTLNAAYQVRKVQNPFMANQWQVSNQIEPVATPNKFNYDAFGNQTWFDSINQTASYDGFQRLRFHTVPGRTEYWWHSGSGADRVMTEIDNSTDPDPNNRWSRALSFYGPDGTLMSECGVRFQSYSHLPNGDLSLTNLPANGPTCRHRYYLAGQNIEDKRDIRDSGWQISDADRKFPFGEMGSYTEADHFATYRRSGGNTGIDYARNRAYFSIVGRFASADPFEGSAALNQPGNWNRYSYGAGDPVNSVDPMGLDSSLSANPWRFNPSGSSSALGFSFSWSGPDFPIPSQLAYNFILSSAITNTQFLSLLPTAVPPGVVRWEMGSDFFVTSVDRRSGSIARTDPNHQMLEDVRNQFRAFKRYVISHWRGPCTNWLANGLSQGALLGIIDSVISCAG